jgi:outer membrane protein OmpU
MMKKLLLGSTALVIGGVMAAPAMAADPIKIGVGGYYTFYGVAGGIDPTYAFNGSFTSYKGAYIFQEGEIHFIGQTKLDNGTSVGLTVELEGWNPANGNATGTLVTANAQIDEAFLFAFGDWGRVEMGSRDAASYRMYYGSPSAFIGWGAIQHNHNYENLAVQSFNVAYNRVTGTTNTPQWQDVERINYFTPRFAGLQIGFGYAPKLNVTATGGQANTGTGNPSGICGYNNATNVPACPTADYAWQDAIDIGANYLNKFGDVTVALYGAFAYASFVPGFGPPGGTLPNVSANMNTGANLTSWKQWVVGAQFGYAGFTLGGAVGYDNNGMGANYYTGVNNDTWFYTGGIMYETGPWQMSFLWVGAYNTNGNGVGNAASITPGTNVITNTISSCGGVPGQNSTCFNGNPATSLTFGQVSVQKYEVGANYALGPGIKMVGGFMYYNAAGPTNLVVGNAWSLMLGMDLRF